MSLGSHCGTSSVTKNVKKYEMVRGNLLDNDVNRQMKDPKHRLRDHRVTWKSLRHVASTRLYALEVIDMNG